MAPPLRLPRVSRLQQMSRANKLRFHMHDSPEQEAHDVVWARVQRQCCLFGGGRASPQRVNQAPDVAVTISEGNTRGIAPTNPWYMVRHQHVAVADIVVCRERSRHVHVALIRERFHEVEPASPDVAKMHVEQFAALAEPADNIKDLAAGIVEHRRNRALAEVEAVIGAFVHQDEALEALDRPHYSRHAAPAGWRIGIMRMAGETYLGGGCYRNDCGEETVDPLPILVFGHDPRQGGRRLRIGPAPAKGLVARTGAPRFPLGARDAQKAEIVLSRGNPGSSEPLDQAAQTIDLALPFRTLGQSDVRPVTWLDRARRDRQLHHV